MALSRNPLTFQELTKAFAEQAFFAGKSWQFSPDPWPLPGEQILEMEAIGQAIIDLFGALEVLLHKSCQDESILRNHVLKTPWVADYLKRGKPDRLWHHGEHRQVLGTLPAVIRPDLLLTDEGFILTEVDPVPGGVGLTAYLNRLYAKVAEGELIGKEDAMVAAFYETIAETSPLTQPTIAIVVSEEAATYHPEWAWLATQCQQLGQPIYCVSPSDLQLVDNGHIAIKVKGEHKPVDVIYRFFELFDLANISCADAIMHAIEQGKVVVTPPMRTFQEEKMMLALFHHIQLKTFWQEQLSAQTYQLLGKIIPPSWLIDDVALPPGAILDAPWIKGRPIRDWRELGEAAQKERNLIIKKSGFHEDAWGARSITLGSDVSKAKWQAAIDQALANAHKHPYILQTYHKPRLVEHRGFDDRGQLVEQKGRLRLCPYFYVRQKQAQLVGALATLCPANKKIIHGMSEATLLPTAKR